MVHACLGHHRVVLDLALPERGAVVREQDELRLSAAQLLFVSCRTEEVAHRHIHIERAMIIIFRQYIMRCCILSHPSLRRVYMLSLSLLSLSLRVCVA